MVSAMWSRVLRRSGSRTHGKWAVVFLLAGASKSRWFWSSSRLKSGRLSSANFHVRSRTVSHSSKNFSIFPVIRKHLRRRLGAVLFSVLTGCRNQRRGRGSDRQWYGDPGALLQRGLSAHAFLRYSRLVGSDHGLPAPGQRPSARTDGAALGRGTLAAECAGAARVQYRGRSGLACGALGAKLGGRGRLPLDHPGWAAGRTCGGREARLLMLKACELSCPFRSFAYNY